MPKRLSSEDALVEALRLSKEAHRLKQEASQLFAAGDNFSAALRYMSCGDTHAEECRLLLSVQGPVKWWLVYSSARCASNAYLMGTESIERLYQDLPADHEAEDRYDSARKWLYGHARDWMERALRASRMLESETKLQVHALEVAVS